MHALRHHYASVLLEGGISIRALAEYLGHADPGFTLRIYSHLMPNTEDRALCRRRRRAPVGGRGGRGRGAGVRPIAASVG